MWYFLLGMVGIIVLVVGCFAGWPALQIRFPRLRSMSPGGFFSTPMILIIGFVFLLFCGEYPDIGFPLILGAVVGFIGILVYAFYRGDCGGNATEEDQERWESYSRHH
jgi:hypothetical protein